MDPFTKNPFSVGVIVSASPAMSGLYLVLLLVGCSLGVCVGEGGVQRLNPTSLQQCPSLQESERVRAEITNEVQAILNRCGSPAWRRVGFVDTTDPSQNCPPGLNITSHPIRTCGSSHTGRRDCSSTTFSVSGVQYSQVCGRIRAYPYGLTYAFYQYLTESRTIEQHPH